MSYMVGGGAVDRRLVRRETKCHWDPMARRRSIDIGELDAQVRQLVRTRVTLRHDVLVVTIR